MRKKFLGLAVIAIAALCVMACDTYTNAAPIDCALVGEWESVNAVESLYDSDSRKSTIKFEADGTYTESGITFEARITDFGYVTLFRDKRQQRVMRYYFSDNKLYLNGIAYERKN
ncbi:MAG: hypothetical protein J1G30_03625 [Spirochaetales bacterium]|nr:hypothetical protein [Spirochaetales bacterium]